jgi:4-hydroxy-tetrahydrodipicolinate synthase
MSPKFHASGNMFNGSIAALVTPFTDQGEIDFAAVDRLVEFHCSQGSDGLVVAGTTGESATLTREEFRELLKRVIEAAKGRLPVLAGTGSTATARAIEQTRLAAELGADGALVVTPYYNKPPQAGLEAHFSAIADAVELDLLLYNVPSRTAIDMLPKTVEALSAHPRIVGIKEALPDGARIEELCSRCGPDFVVLSGDDNSCLDAMRQGAAGVVSVAANVVPEAMHELCMAAAQQDWPEANQLESQIKTLFEVLMIETNPIPVKWALFEMGLVGPGIRLPLTPLDKEFHAPLRQCLVEQQLVRA